MAASDISQDIIEELYTEALLLADDARATFDLRPSDQGAENDDLARVALSIEGLRTTTRLMHVLAWLLNQRAFMAGELSEPQLRRCGRLPEERQADAENLSRLEPATRALIEESERLHARVARLDRGRHTPDALRPSVHSLQGRIEQAFGTG